MSKEEIISREKAAYAVGFLTHLVKVSNRQVKKAYELIVRARGYAQDATRKHEQIRQTVQAQVTA